jgi:predicted MFS family arabinose efflux permease
MLAACPTAAAFLLWLKGDLLPKAALGPQGRQKRGSSFDLLRNANIRNAIIASGLISVAWDLYLFFFPIYGHSIGLSASSIGIIISMFSAAVFVIRVALPRLARMLSEFEILLYAIGFAGAALLLFPLFRDPYLLALASFVLGLGCGVGQPMSMSLIYSLSPAGRASEGAGLRVMFNHFTHLVVPLAFGAVGTAFGFAPVFVSCSALMLGGSGYGFWVERRSVRPGTSVHRGP